MCASIGDNCGSQVATVVACPSFEFIPGPGTKDKRFHGSLLLTVVKAPGHSRVHLNMSSWVSRVSWEFKQRTTAKNAVLMLRSHSNIYMQNSNSIWSWSDFYETTVRFSTFKQWKNNIEIIKCMKINDNLLSKTSSCNCFNRRI